jgi:tetratricopeptide (TPR) repeat protein
MDAALGPSLPVRRRAEELYQSASRASNAYRPREAVLKLRRGLRLLGGARDAEGAELRIRMLITLAYNDAELNTLQHGLPHLVAATASLPAISDEFRRIDLDAVIRGQRGIMLMRAGQHAASISELNETVALREQLHAQGNPNLVAFVIDLSNRAHVHTAMGHPGPAGRDLRRVSAMAETALVESASEDDSQRLAVLAARARQNLGSLAYRVGDLPRALKYYEEASQRFREIAPSILPKIRRDQAEALLAAGMADEAAPLLDEALPELRRLRNYQDLAEAESLRAAAALVTGDETLARRMANSARRRFLRRGNEAWAAIAALTRLRAEVAAALDGNRKPGAKLPERALELADALGKLRLVDEASVARLLAVRLMLRRGEVEQATRHLTEVPAPRRVTPVDHRMLRWLCRAELAVAEHRLARAFAQARAGLVELSRVRDRMGGLEMVSGPAVHGRELGELAVRLVVDRRGSGARQLFTWSEKTRAQVYRYEPLPSLDDPVLTEKVQEYRLLSRSVAEAERDGRPVREMRSRHAALQREVMRLGWRDRPWGRPRPIASFTQVAEGLEDRALVSFVASRQDMLAVVVVAGRARLLRLGRVASAAASAGELHADLDALSPDYLRGPLAEAVARSARTRAERLDDQLVRPLEKVIGDRELVVVPTGSLYAVAWGVLPSLRGRPVSIAPSATAWLAAMGLPGSGSESGSGSVSGAGSGSGSGSGPGRSGSGGSGSGGSNSPAGRTVLVGGPGLPAAQGEVGGLRRYHPDAVLLESDSATVPAVLDVLDGASLAHVAAHGSHEPENALFSQLELVDGALYAHETARLRRPPEHVVLAACELALSRIRPGDEALGFAGALLASGGRTVTAAVSRVGDQAAAAAMADYHRLLAAGSEPAVALAEAAAVDPLRRPFVCLGASRPVAPPSPAEHES